MVLTTGNLGNEVGLDGVQLGKGELDLRFRGNLCHSLRKDIILLVRLTVLRLVVSLRYATQNHFAVF